MIKLIHSKFCVEISKLILDQSLQATSSYPLRPFDVIVPICVYLVVTILCQGHKFSQGRKMAQVKPTLLVSVNTWCWSVIGRRLLEPDASSDSHQEVLHLAIFCLLQELWERPALPLWHPTTGLRWWGGRIRPLAQVLGLPGAGLWWQWPAADWWQRGCRGVKRVSWCVAVLWCCPAGETRMFRHSGGLDWDHGGLDGDRAQAEAPRGPSQVGFGGWSPSDGGNSRGDYGRGVGGQPSSGGGALGLEHAAVGLTDVAVSGDGGGFIKVWWLLLVTFVICPHGVVVTVWYYQEQKTLLPLHSSAQQHI